METTESLTPSALIRRLSEAGYSPTKVAAMLDGRLSYRALYRWQNGESQPQRKMDYTAVLDLAVAIGVITSDERERASSRYSPPALTDDENDLTEPLTAGGTTDPPTP